MLHGGDSDLSVHDAPNADGLEQAISKQLMVGTHIWMAASGSEGALIEEEHLDYVVEPWDIRDLHDMYRVMEENLRSRMAISGMNSGSAIVVTATKIFTPTGKLDFRDSYGAKYETSFHPDSESYVEVFKEDPEKYFV